MKRLTPAIIGLTMLVGTASQAAGATDGAMLEMAAHNGCFICHKVKADPGNGKPLAPAYADIAARYRGRTGAFDRLLDRVMHGTVYREQAWSDQTSMRFMPPNLNVSRRDAEALVDWVLTMDVEPEALERLSRDDRNMTAATVSGCTACHLMEPIGDRRLIPLAPSFREIAARYKDDGDSRSGLVESVLQGTMGQPKRWPNVNMQYMPASVAMSKEQVEGLVDWILGLDTTGVVDRWTPQSASR